MYQILSSGSKGNAILYHNSILLDCGVPFSLIKPHINNIQIILLTHIHNDHINFNVLRTAMNLRPTLRIGCCEWMLQYLEGFKNVDVYDIGKIFDYGVFSIAPFRLYHDVPNCGYRIFKDGTKIFHATDTSHLQGITAKNYDLYAIEANYNEDTIYEIIAAKKARGEFAHQEGAINSHLSEQQSRDFFFNNAGEYSQLIRLHESKTSI